MGKKVHGVIHFNMHACLSSCNAINMFPVVLTIMFIITVYLAAVCDDGSIQLANGQDESEGRVEVCYNGQWGTVCSDDFGPLDGTVVCRQLGYEGIKRLNEYMICIFNLLDLQI